MESSPSGLCWRGRTMSRAVTTFTPPDPPKTTRSTATRARLLQAAADLFLANGYEAVSMNDVADRAGITRAGLYRHYRSKGQLLVDVIRWKYRQFEQAPAFLDAIAEPKSAISLLWSDDGRDVRLLVTDAAAAARHDPEVLAGMAALDADRRAAVTSRLEGLPADAEAVAWLILGLASGIGMREAIGTPRPDAARLEPALARLIDALLD